MKIFYVLFSFLFLAFLLEPVSARKICYERGGNCFEPPCPVHSYFIGKWDCMEKFCCKWQYSNVCYIEEGSCFYHVCPHDYYSIGQIDCARDQMCCRQKKIKTTAQPTSDSTDPQPTNASLPTSSSPTNETNVTSPSQDPSQAFH